MNAVTGKAWRPPASLESTSQSRASVSYLPSTPTGFPKIDGPLAQLRIAHVHIMPRDKTVTSDFYVEEVLKGTDSVDDKASNGEHASNSAAVKLRPDMSQGIFQQDGAPVEKSVGNSHRP